MLDMIRIIIVDDHAVVREGIKQILAGEVDMMVAGEAGSGAEMLCKIMKQSFDLLLLDISMPGRDGLEVLKELKVLLPKLPVLILSMHPEEQYAVRTLRAGAAGYLTKASAPEELITAIRKVSRGGKYITISLAEKLAFDLDAGTDKPLHEKLSNREYEVMLMLAAGKLASEAARELRLSTKTISTYRSRIMEKMGMNKNAELTMYAMKNNLLN
jgi:two-component system, NarL family, invasion response regulator UvrY